MCVNQPAARPARACRAVRHASCYARPAVRGRVLCLALACGYLAAGRRAGGPAGK